MERAIPVLPGVNLTMLQTDQFKTGCMSVNLVRPLCRDEAAANALLPDVLLRGTREYPTMAAISERLDTLYGASMGGLVRKKGEVQTSGFYADFLSDHLAPDGAEILRPMAGLLGQTLLAPCLEGELLRPDYVAGEQVNLINAIESAVNNKRAWAMKRLVGEMCRGEAYGLGRLGEAEDVRALTSETLTAQWRALVRDSQIEIFYLGRAGREELVSLLREALEGLPRAERFSVPQTQAPRAAGQPRTITERMDVTQAKLCIGLRTGVTCRDAEYPALVMLNAVFGSGVTSKLFVHVREERSLCYYASSSLEKFKGLMFISSGVEEENCDVAREEILRQLEACRRGEITDAELDAARRQLDSALRMTHDSPGGLDDFYLGQALAGLDGTLEDLRAALARVTKGEIVDAARRVTLDTIYELKGARA